MTRISATEFKNNIGEFSDAAMVEPVIITNRQRDRLVLMSADEYRRLTNMQGEMSPAQLMEQRLEKHRNTIVELAKR